MEFCTFETEFCLSANQTAVDLRPISNFPENV